MTGRQTLLYHSLKNLYLLDKAPKTQVVSDLMGLQAQFARNPQYSLWLRASDYDPERWGDGLVKIWSHRGTMYVVPEGEVGLHLSAVGYPDAFQEGAWGMTAREMDYWSAFLIDQIRAGNQTRDSLKAACRRAGIDEDLLGRVFYGWGGLIREMVLRGRIVMKTGTEKAYFVPERVGFLPRDDARREMIRRYFTQYGPATLTDFRMFFTNYRMAEVRPLLDELLPQLLVTEIDGEKYYHARPLEEPGEIPECILVPGFDNLVSGYRDRSRMIDKENASRLVNQAGIVFPSVILRGRMRASWKIEGDKITVTPFERLLKKDEAAVRRAVRARLSPAIRRVEFLPQP